MFSLLLICLMGNASPHTSFPEAVDKRTVRHLLSSSERSQDLKKLGPEGYKQLRAIMFSPSEKIEHRWNAVLSLAKIGGTDSLADVEKALKDSTWYMRSAGLLATRLIDKQMGQARAKELMSHDPALMVRASALQVLAQDEKVDRPYLWSQLKNPRNFNNGRGLSIRESILQVLGQNVQKKETAQFVELLNEKDPAIQAKALKALETIFAKKVPAGLPREKQLAFFQNESKIK